MENSTKKSLITFYANSMTVVYIIPFYDSLNHWLSLNPWAMIRCKPDFTFMANES